MAVTVETLEKLERKMTLTLPVNTIQSEVDSRLKKLARTVKMDGFRPGKVPMNVVAQRYGYSVHYEVMNDKVGEAFAVAANEAKLRVAGQPKISEKEAPRRRTGVRRGVRGLPGSQDRRPGRRRGGKSQRRSQRRGHRQDPGHPAQAAPHLRPARADAPRRTATAPRSTSKARSTASPSPAARPRTSSSWSAKARCSRNSKSRARHEDRREQDLPAGLPGRLPRQGRGRQDRPTSWSP
jgi:hypothetical protein